MPGPLISIRMASAGDGAALAGIYGPYVESTPISFEVLPPTPADMSARVAKITAQFPWLVLERDGAIVGYAYASAHAERAAYRWGVDTGVYVARESRRSGVGRALYAALFPLLVAQGYYKAYAGVTVPNPGSVGLHEAVGFTLVGVYREVGYKLGAWHDVAWFERPLQPLRGEPEPPRPVSAIVGTAEWQAALARGAGATA